MMRGNVTVTVTVTRTLSSKRFVSPGVRSWGLRSGPGQYTDLQYYSVVFILLSRLLTQNKAQPAHGPLSCILARSHVPWAEVSTMKGLLWLNDCGRTAHARRLLAKDRELPRVLVQKLPPLPPTKSRGLPHDWGFTNGFLSQQCPATPRSCFFAYRGGNRCTGARRAVAFQLPVRAGVARRADPFQTAVRAAVAVRTGF